MMNSFKLTLSGKHLSALQFSTIALLDRVILDVGPGFSSLWILLACKVSFEKSADNLMSDKVINLINILSLSKF